MFPKKRLGPFKVEVARIPRGVMDERELNINFALTAVICMAGIQKIMGKEYSSILTEYSPTLLCGWEPWIRRRYFMEHDGVRLHYFTFHSEE